ncbi:MAG: response regulator transcription factor [Campylobacterota bacterium]
MRILIVEDEVFTAEFIRQTLQGLGYSDIAIVDNAAAAQDECAKSPVSLIFMDINIKGSVDGLQLARMLSIGYLLDVVFITSYHDSQTIEEASLCAPLGFLIKPIIKSDIEAMMMVVGAKKPKEAATAQDSSKMILLHDIAFDLQTQTVTHKNSTVKLSKLETKALEIFMQNLDKTLSSEKLIAAIWGDQRAKSSLRELVSRLRKKMPQLNLQSYSNIGYILYSN